MFFLGFLLSPSDIISYPIYALAKDLLSLCLATTGVVIAIIGLSTWKKQIKGVKEFEIGYELNYSVLKLREAIKHVRNPMIWNAEFEKASEKYESVEDKEKHASVYRMRWEKINEAYTEMESHLLGAEIHWGNDVLKKMKPLKEAVKKLNIGLYKFLSEDFVDEKADLHDLVYNSGNDEKPDEFSKEVDKAVDGVHEFIEEKYH